jgi:hypothetical protein
MTLEQLAMFLLLGFLPWHIHCESTPSKKHRIHWRIYALFWRLMITHRKNGQKSWSFSMPLVKRLASSVWAALHELLIKH